MMIGVGKHIRSRWTSGITMLELMIIVVIMGVLAALAAPSFYAAMPRLKARSEARNMLNLVRLARSKAIADGAQYGVYFDTSSGTYRLFKDLVNLSSATFDGGDSTITGPVSVNSDVTLASVSFSNDCLVFQPTGGASESGNVSVSADGGAVSYSISVIASTGRARLQ